MVFRFENIRSFQSRSLIIEISNSDRLDKLYQAFCDLFAFIPQAVRLVPRSDSVHGIEFFRFLQVDSDCQCFDWYEDTPRYMELIKLYKDSVSGINLADDCFIKFQSVVGDLL